MLFLDRYLDAQKKKMCALRDTIIIVVYNESTLYILARSDVHIIIIMTTTFNNVHFTYSLKERNRCEGRIISSRASYTPAAVIFN